MAMKSIVIVAVLVLFSLPAFAQDEIPLRSQSNIILQIFQVDRTLAQAGSVNTAIVYGSDQETAGNMKDILEGRGLNAEVLSESEFESQASGFNVAYFTPDAQPDPDMTADNEILSIGTNEQHFEDGSISISFQVDADQQLMIMVNRDQLDNENHEMESGFFDLQRVVASN